MSFTLTCPICGKRDVYEFHFGGHERGPRPAQENLRAKAHFQYVQFRTTSSKAQQEWWYHASGCGVWFQTWRNPATNREEPPPEMNGGCKG